MISFLRGQLRYKQPPLLIVEVAGVGYEVQASMTTFYQLPEIGQDIFLHTHLVVREDAHSLYGFAHDQERVLFRALIKVNGVGAKLALAILSGIEPDHFVRCVMDNDTQTLVRVPGVGKKTAERLVIEMRDRLHDWVSPHLCDTSIAANPKQGNLIQDAISALVALGFKPQEASRAISLVKQEYANREELIRLALQKTLT
jgi:Holliday junction DNA helicase RuvA